MKERGILFSAPMVRAILAGHKTQTRRIVKPQPPSIEAVRAKAGIDYHLFNDGRARNRRGDPLWRVAGPVWAVRDLMGGAAPNGVDWKCPHGVPGDHLWVRERHALLPADAPWSPPIVHKGGGTVLYAADIPEGEPMPAAWAFDGWRPGIHMFRWASRIDLAIVNIRVERLQNISEADAQEEGVPGPARGAWPEGFGSWTHNGRRIDGRPWAHQFLQLWMQIHGHESAHANPWVWVVEFRRDESRQAELRERAQATPTASIGGLIERSSLGAAMRDIKERGIDAHLEDLSRDLDKPWRRR